MRRLLTVLLLVTAACPAGDLRAQAAKEVNEQAQFWISLNTTARLSDGWGAVGDVHVRRNDFLKEPSFDLLRFGVHRWLRDSLAVTLGYAHNWVAPAEEGWHTWTDEDRIYQQVQYWRRGAAAPRHDPAGGEE